MSKIRTEHSPVNSRLAQKLARKLFPAAAEQSSFLEALASRQNYPQAIIWTDGRPEENPFVCCSPAGWQQPFVDRLIPGQQPGQHPFHVAGRLYCLDASSIFQAAALLAVASAPQTICDVCAAPGGKSIIVSAMFRPKLLLCNEVIRKRSAMLIDNLRRCRIPNATVVSQDPARLAEALPESVELAIADAPCTGQSLLARGKRAPGCFHPANIKLNSGRQKRIVANAIKLVAPGGHLLYSTCTYSPEENEEVAEWALSRFSEFQPVAVLELSSYQSPLTSLPCYRIFPHRGEGAGGFSVLLKRAGDKNPFPPPDLCRLPVVWCAAK